MTAAARRWAWSPIAYDLAVHNDEREQEPAASTTGTRTPSVTTSSSRSLSDERDDRPEQESTNLRSLRFQGLPSQRTRLGSS